MHVVEIGDMRRLLSMFFALSCVITACASTSTEGVPDSPTGFSQQYMPLFSAWSKNDSRKLDRLLEDFAIPKQWLIDTFGPEEGRELADLYTEQFEDFKLHISRSFAMAAGVGRSLAQKKYHGAPAQLLIGIKPETDVKLNPPAKPAPDSVQPLPAIKRFTTQSRLRVRDQEQDLTSWMDSFAYIDGKFRFLGRGGYPFWDAARVRLADPCAKPDEQTGGKVTKKVEPEYPQAAKEQKIQGTVTARLTIGTDGAVRTVEVTGGPPELADAARNAFQQWQYTPFMSCGKAVEMRSIEHITFSLP